MLASLMKSQFTQKEGRWKKKFIDGFLKKGREKVQIQMKTHKDTVILLTATALS